MTGCYETFVEILPSTRVHLNMQVLQLQPFPVHMAQHLELYRWTFSRKCNRPISPQLAKDRIMGAFLRPGRLL